MEIPKILKLDEAVSNRIAAGEVIQRPANALKELIENSLDAKSTNIQIIVKNGGLKSLQIHDNGVGIRREDFEIVCERFTTSKLREFEDLTKIATFGFRGEALASISHVAHLSIISKTSTDKCAYKASYNDGVLKSSPVPIAANQGTQIIVEDLFYNMTVRKKALRSPSEEYNKIFEVVSKYAIHNSHVGFALKKQGENNAIKTKTNSTKIENILLIFGSEIAKELVEFDLENATYRFKVSGLVTNPNYSTKKLIFLLFINGRLVDCPSLKRSLDQVYTTYLPKNSHPFIYISLELDPASVDVNVHPTKQEVHFFNEEEIVELIITAVEAKLLGSNNSRTFYAKAKPPVLNTKLNENRDKNEKIAQKDFIRTDCNEQKLTKFFIPGGSKEKLNCSIDDEAFEKFNEDFVKRTKELENFNVKINHDELKGDHLEKNKFEENKFENNKLENNKIQNKININENLNPKDKEIHKINKNEESKINPPNKTKKSAFSQIPQKEIQLISVLQLRQEIEENAHKNLRELFSQHVFVGTINPKQSLIQYNTKLYLCNTKKILQELLYQFQMYNFQNFEKIPISPPLDIYNLTLIALDQPEVEWTPEDGPKEELARRVTEILTEKGEMLNEYFSLEIDECGTLRSIPILIENYIPDVVGLPVYLLRLASEVNWETEKDCFKTFAHETALYYSQLTEETYKDEGKWEWVTENVLYPAIKKYFLPPKNFTENNSILEIADLPNLYKVFERC